GAVKGVAGWSRRPETVRLAREKGIITTGCASAEECAALGDILIMAVPMRSMEELSRKISSCAKKSLRAVFDLGSAKAEIGRHMAPLWGAPYAGFHPMAGRETGGLENADPHLFVGATCAVVPFEDTSPEAVALARELALALGGRPVEMSAPDHDAAVAAISHLPLLAASALSLVAGREGEENPFVSLLAAGGFRDTTRIAAGPPWLGADMADQNRAEIKRLAEELAKILLQMANAPVGELEAMLTEAAAARGAVMDADRAANEGSL
ncbi:MAG: prephenate dehydrogenase, partial [Synergistaceae bacterium]|nr:prephenate dehydrogenase [Synergistaceae bacterium]